MAQPAVTGMASASAAPPAQPTISTSSNATPNEGKTQAHVSMPTEFSSSQQKSLNVAATGAVSSPASTETSTASVEAKSSGQLAESTVNSGTDASAMDRALRTQEEARRLQFALAQQQVEQYQAMTKQLEAQSGIAMTPSSTIGGSNGTITASMAGLAKTSEDLQKLRQEQLAKLQQNVQHQAAMAAQAVQKRNNEEWLRSKLLLEQEHLRLLRLHEQQLKQTKGNTVTAATATSIADGLLAQQQQVMRQQQLLRDMMQKQQAQRQLQIQLQKGDKSTTNSVTTTTARPYVTTAPTYYSLKKKKSKTTFDTDLEALAKVCIRVANSRTDCEMRQALDKMTSWLHRCTELMLLQIAQRDYRDCLAHRRPMLIQQDRWSLDLQVKSEFITQKIVQMLAAFMLREKNKAAQQEAAAKAAVAASSAVATAAAATTSTGVNAATTATSGSPTTASATSTPPATVSAVSTATTVPAAPAATPSSQSTIPSLSVRAPVKRDMAAVEREYAEIKAQLQAKQIETNQKAKAKRDAAKLEAAKVSSSETTAAMVAASYKRPLQVEIPGSVKKPRIDSFATPSPSISTGYRPSTTTVPPISPRVAQQFYDLDLATRASTKSEDKMYLPSKIISKIMYRALPGDNEDDAASTESAKGRTPSPAVSPTHSVQEVDSCQDSISISDDAVTFMQECVTEFLLYFTSESRDLSIMQNRRTKKGVGLSISGSNVVESMENLGFTSYARVLSGYNEKVKASQDAAARKKIERKKLVQQQALHKAIAAKSAISPQALTTNGLKPMLPSPLTRPSSATSMSPVSTITRVTPTATAAAPAKPVVVPAKPTTPVAKPVIPVATSAAATPTK